MCNTILTSHCAQCNPACLQVAGSPDGYGSRQQGQGPPSHAAGPWHDASIATAAELGGTIPAARATEAGAWPATHGDAARSTISWWLSYCNARHAVSRSSHVPHERPSPSTHDGNAPSTAPYMGGPAIHAASPAYTASADAGSTAVAPRRTKPAGPAHAALDASRCPATSCSPTSAPRCIRHAACSSNGYGSRSTWDGCSQQISSAGCAGAAADCRNSTAGASSSCRRTPDQAGAGGSSSSSSWRYGGSTGDGRV